MLNSPRQLDMNGGSPIETPHGPAVLVPLAWLSQWPGLYALVCAWRCVSRIGDSIKSGQVVNEALRLTPGICFSHDTANRAISYLADKAIGEVE